MKKTNNNLRWSSRKGYAPLLIPVLIGLAVVIFIVVGGISHLLISNLLPPNPSKPITTNPMPLHPIERPEAYPDWIISAYNMTDSALTNAKSAIIDGWVSMPYGLKSLSTGIFNILAPPLPDLSPIDLESVPSSPDQTCNRDVGAYDKKEGECEADRKRILAEWLVQNERPLATDNDANNEWVREYAYFVKATNDESSQCMDEAAKKYLCR